MLGSGGGGYGADSFRRRVQGSAPFPGTPGGPSQPPLPPGQGRGFPNIQAPLPAFPRQPSPWENDLSQLGFTPESIPWLKGKREFPGPERLGEVAGAQRSLNAGTYGPQPLRGGGGYGEGYQGGALRRLLMARMGGGY